MTWTRLYRVYVHISLAFVTNSTGNLAKSRGARVSDMIPVSPLIAVYNGLIDLRFTALYRD